jgi:hypothetical protein
MQPPLINLAPSAISLTYLPAISQLYPLAISELLCRLPWLLRHHAVGSNASDSNASDSNAAAVGIAAARLLDMRW